MKNRKLLYILIPATAIVWGAIAWTIISNMKGSADYNQEDYLPYSEVHSDTIEEGYTLLANYPDPFKAQRISSPVTTVQKKATSQPKYKRTARRTTLMRRVVWPQVEYYGVIMNKDQRLALLRINNAKTILQTGDENNQIKLLKIYNDSVQLVYENEEKIFRKISSK